MLPSLHISQTQVSLLLKLSIGLLLYCACRLTSAGRPGSLGRAQQCRESDENLAAFVAQLNNISFRPSSGEPNTIRFQHDLNSDCPSRWGAISNDGLHNISLCPWTYHINTDYNRYPNDILYARCSCGWCSSQLSVGPRSRCYPLYHSYQVIRRECDRGQYRYTYTHESLPIACVCSHHAASVVDIE
ncbi:interleukin-17B [Aplysia californica]|uniref:Interleukin-17B n=1 Tax=Aplysia californica TaxID=6500 RepID=A0ABM0JML7_APLCA|nr:interleukin-17B [Aplysia californica]